MPVPRSRLRRPLPQVMPVGASSRNGPVLNVRTPPIHPDPMPCRASQGIGRRRRGRRRRADGASARAPGDGGQTGHRRVRRATAGRRGIGACAGRRRAGARSGPSGPMVERRSRRGSARAAAHSFGGYGSSSSTRAQNPVMPRRASEWLKDRGPPNGGSAPASAMPRRASPWTPFLRSRCPGGHHAGQGHGGSPAPAGPPLRPGRPHANPGATPRARPRKRRTPPGRGPGASGCSSGTAYRIRTGGLRLERAVSWASRRMRRWRLGKRTPDRPA